MLLFLISLIIYFIYIIPKTLKNLQMLQQNRYNRGDKYFKWIKKNLAKNYLTVELLTVLIFLGLLLPLKYIPILFISIYIVITIIMINKNRNEKQKLPLKLTFRIIRLLITLFIIYLVSITLIILFYNNEYILIYYFILIIMGYLNNLIVILANYINIPIELFVSYTFKRKAKNKLKESAYLSVIGITGSYGKTSSKNILNDILNIQYNSVKTPKNYNTPYGLIITINNYLDKFSDYFIAEMGACKVGEIKELCDLVKPKYGIITKIGLSHLETFKSEENIIKTKFELIESLPSDGVGILNADDRKQVNYKVHNNCKLLWVGIDNQEKADFYATNIRLTKDGTVFECYIKELNKKYTFTTRLLGKANVYNILAGIALGYYLKIPVDKLILAVKKIKPVEHRLNMKKYYDMYLIDDAYNANPEGAKMALDVLKMMKGYKIVITSGIIEMGKEDYRVNKELGIYMADKTDIAILIGEKQTKPIYEGLIEKRFKEKNIYVLNDIMISFSLLHQLKKGDTYVLLQSDLPDIFNEN